MTDQAVISETTCKQQMQQQQQLQQQQQQQQQHQQQQEQQQQQQQQHEYQLETYHAPSADDIQKEEKGYTVVPASVSFRGVSMKLDLKIDQKTLAAATNFSKVVEEAVSTHLSSSVIPVENDEVDSSQVPHVPSTSTLTSAQPLYSLSSFASMEAANSSTKESPVICDSSVESSTLLLTKNELREQVNEVCSSTVDASPFCDTACSPIQLESQPKSQNNTVNAMKCSEDTPPGSSVEDQNKSLSDFLRRPPIVFNNAPQSRGTLSARTLQNPSSIENRGFFTIVLNNSSKTSLDPGNESRSSVKEEQIVPQVAAATENIYLTPCPSTSSAEVDAAPSPAVGKRRKEKAGTASHLCEQIDPEKGPCRQRAIVGFRYCIRHILLDPEAPYIRCQHRRKPKSKRDTSLMCTNAVRKDRGTIYCSTHLIMDGKMEPKKKKANRATAVVESTELNLSGNAWNRSAPQKSIISAQSSALINTYEEMNCATRPVELCITSNGTVYNNVPNGAVIALDPVTNKRTVYNIPKTSVTTAVPMEGIVTVPATAVATAAPRCEIATYNTTSSNNTNYVKVPVLSDYRPVAATASSYGVSRTTYECPTQATTSRIVQKNPPPSYSNAALNQVVTHTVVKTRCGVQIPCAQPTIIKQRGPANLTKQHPQLAAKLLQGPASGTVQRIVPLSTGASLRTGFAKNACPPPLLIPDPHDILPSQAPFLVLQQEPPRFYKIPDEEAKSTAKQAAKDGLPPKPKVIQLKQKRRRAKMTGIYRKIPQIDHMCKVLEDQDFDRTDLFPLGLEPSDDEDEEMDNLGLRWSEMACNTLDYPASQGALQVYLLKKQIRLDKNALMKEAIVNAPIMHASKEYPNSTGAALAHRASKYGASGDARNVQKRCHYMISNGTSPPIQCTEKCLPYCNHCSQHISYNLNQKVCKYCAEPCCSRPVLWADAPKTSMLCKYHYEARERKRAEEALAQENAHKFWKEQTSISYVQQQPIQPYEEDAYMGMPSCYQSHSAGNDHLHSANPSEFYDLDIGSGSSGNESDVYLSSSFPKDLELGLNGQEINEMLANYNPTEGEGGADILHDQSFSDGLKDDYLQLPPTGFNGHDWVDLEQFLISEGVDLTPPTADDTSIISVPQPMSNLTVGPGGSYAGSSLSEQQQQQ